MNPVEIIAYQKMSAAGISPEGAVGLFNKLAKPGSDSTVDGGILGAVAYGLIGFINGLRDYDGNILIGIGESLKGAALGYIAGSLIDSTL